MDKIRVDQSMPALGTSVMVFGAVVIQYDEGAVVLK